jgi:hypothetical protein
VEVSGYFSQFSASSPFIFYAFWSHTQTLPAQHNTPHTTMKYLVAVDFSGSSQKALEKALDMVLIFIFFFFSYPPIFFLLLIACFSRL